MGEDKLIARFDVWLSDFFLPNIREYDIDVEKLLCATEINTIHQFYI